jgi:hypothetical protein
LLYALVPKLYLTMAKTAGRRNHKIVNTLGQAVFIFCIKLLNPIYIFEFKQISVNMIVF